MEKLKSFASIFGLIALPIVTLIIGNNYTKAIKEREVQGRFVELAVGILSSNPSSENKNIRSWSIDVINLYSGVQIDSETRNDLINKIPINSTSDAEIVELYELAEEAFNNGGHQICLHLTSKLIYNYHPSAELLSKIILLEGKSHYKLREYKQAIESLERLTNSESTSLKIKEEARKIIINSKNELRAMF